MDPEPQKRWRWMSTKRGMGAAQDAPSCRRTLINERSTRIVEGDYRGGRFKEKEEEETAPEDGATMIHSQPDNYHSALSEKKEKRGEENTPNTKLYDSIE